MLLSVCIVMGQCLGRLTRCERERGSTMAWNSKMTLCRLLGDDGGAEELVTRAMLGEWNG